MLYTSIKDLVSHRGQQICELHCNEVVKYNPPPTRKKNEQKIASASIAIGGYRFLLNLPPILATPTKKSLASCREEPHAEAEDLEVKKFTH